MNHTEMALAGSWDPQLVVLSYLIAVFASYTALDFAAKVTATGGRARIAWLAGGAFAMGTGIWAMHFTGMLAFRMPMPVTYNVPITLLSMTIAIGASALALFTVSRRTMRTPQFLIAGFVLGIGIASMHYTGMAAMQMPATISYDLLLFTLSILIAIAASIAALWLAFRFSVANNTGGSWQWAKGGSALVMGAAIVGMHYTGMAAANFVGTHESMAGASSGINTLALGFGIGITTLAILGLALVSSIVDRRFSAQAKELKRSERRYESLFGHNPDGVYSLDLEGKVLTANAAAEKITGYRAEELHQERFADFVIEEDSGRASHYFERAVWGEAQNYEIAITNKEGRRVEVNVTSIPIVVDDEVVGIYGITKDVTKRKQAEEDRARLAAIVESSDDVIIGKTLEGIITSWNQGAERIYGYSAEEAVGQPISMLVPPERPNEIPLILESIRRGKKVDHFETVRVAKDGRKLEISLTVSPIRNAAGDIVGASTIARDITERKRVEEAMRQAREAERRRIARDLHDGVLQDLSYAVQAMEVTKLQAQGTGLEGELQNEVDAIRSAAHGLRAAVNDLHLADELDQLFPRLLESLVERNREMTRSQQIGLEVKEGFPSEPLGEASTQLLRILQEALTNAWRHSGAKSVLMVLRSEGNNLVVEVSDDGRGLTPETVPGVGLRSMRERAVSLGGELTVEGEPGKGTRVRLRVPMPRS
jgi:PAS domain S-box-containing protein